MVSSVVIVLFLLWLLGLVAGQHLAFWFHIVALHALGNLAYWTLRRRGTT